MKLTQLKTITTEAVKQALGSEEIANLEDGLLVDVGKDIIDLTDDTVVEKFANALVIRIAKIEYDNRVYDENRPKMYRDNFEWGGMIERVYYDILDFDDENGYNLVGGKVYDNVNKFYAPKATAKIFAEIKGISVNVSRATNDLKMAFTSWDEMDKFISGIENQVRNTFAVAMEEYGKMLLQTGIAIGAKATNNAIHLLTEYKEEYGLTEKPTIQEALQDREFYIFSAARIGIARDRLRDFNQAFNDGTVPTFTPNEDNCLVMLSDFIRRLRTRLLGDAFNPSEYALGDYQTVSYWQGIKSDSDTYKWDTISKVMFSDPENKLGLNAEGVEDGNGSVENVVGFLYDRMAIGYTFNNRRTTSSYNADGEFINNFHKADVNYFVDTKYAMIPIILD